MAQFILAFGNAMIRKPSIILIDEPELNLHPRMQIDFLTSLASYADNCLLFATHSIGLARSTSDCIYCVTKTAGASQIKPIEMQVCLVEFLGEMSFSSFREIGGTKLLLVEGTTDVKTVQQFLRKAKKDHEVVVLPLGGDGLARGGVEHELSEIQRWSDHIFVLVDSERENADSPPVARCTEFVETCSRLGFKVHVTQRRATENYLTDAAIKRVFGDAKTALDHFESLERHANGWRKTENWRIAREMTWDDIKATDVGEFIGSI